LLVRKIFADVWREEHQISSRSIARNIFAANTTGVLPFSPCSPSPFFALFCALQINGVSQLPWNQWLPHTLRKFTDATPAPQ
jgi:hypothetical protein